LPPRTKPAIACKGTYEREVSARGFRYVAGVDEVGRGSLFGPVVAAAVVLSAERPIRGLRDSKLLPQDRREVLAARIKERAIAWAIGAADVYEIDRINIYQASRLAMRRAVERLSPACDFLLVDAIAIDLPLPQEAIIHGDAKCQCIAAASILAKTHRDECMRQWDAVFPHLGLSKHKGYSTPEHIDAISKHGPTLLHRFSFEPVRLACPYEIWTGYDQNKMAANEASA
jgi:ribonuclease HII